LAANPNRRTRELLTEIARLRQLFDKAPGFMAATRGPDHVFEMANPSYQRLVGERELIGRTVAEAFPDLAGSGFVERLDSVYAEGKAFGGHSHPIKLQRTPGGELEERYLDYVFQPIVEEDGEVVGLFVEGYDITDRHLVELQLRESEERFRLIADSAPVPIWVTKLDRKRSFVNRAYAEFLGLAYEQALEFDWRSVIHPEDVDRVVAASVTGEHRMQAFILEARYRRGDGEYRWLHSESQPRFGPAGEHIGFIGVAHDITEAKLAEAALREVNETLERRVEERTADLRSALERLRAEMAERRRAEQALRQAQKMEAVGQLTGGIAHDFNNLLTPIIGGLELITMRTEDERLKRMAETALGSARRGAKLTSQLLAFSRIQRIAMAPVLVNEIVANMQDLLRRTIGSDVTIATELAPDAGWCLCDANQLENAILNLAINARDAMPEGGTLSIATGRAALSSEAELGPGDYVCVAVSDTGEGMTQQVLERATEPFFSTKPIGKGTGLGLAQVYGIARQSGGTLKIESEVGRGTVVRLILPAAEQPAAAEPEQSALPDPAEASRGSSGATILIVDDDADVRAFLSAALEGLGHGVAAVGDSQQALAWLERGRPDLLLLDYAMPGMHGADLACEVRQRLPDLAIVFVTGYAQSDQLEGALGKNAPVLRKPFTVAQLANMLAEHLPASN
jgi:PAS domain S-box-containing protein